MKFYFGSSCFLHLILSKEYHTEKRLPRSNDKTNTKILNRNTEINIHLYNVSYDMNISMYIVIYDIHYFGKLLFQSLYILYHFNLIVIHFETKKILLKEFVSNSFHSTGEIIP